MRWFIAYAVNLDGGVLEYAQASSEVAARTAATKLARHRMNEGISPAQPFKIEVREWEGGEEERCPRELALELLKVTQ